MYIMKIVFLIAYVLIPIYIGFKYGLFRWIQRLPERERKMIDADRDTPNKVNFIMYFGKNLILLMKILIITLKEK